MNASIRSEEIESTDGRRRQQSRCGLRSRGRHPRLRAQRHRLSAPRAARRARKRLPLEPNAEATVNNVNSLIQRVAGTSLAEIEKLISELESLRDLLHAEGQRVQREISGYAQLSQAAMKSTRMIADNVTQWKRAADGLRNS